MYLEAALRTEDFEGVTSATVLDSLLTCCSDSEESFFIETKDITMHSIIIIHSMNTHIGTAMSSFFLSTVEDASDDDAVR